MKITIVNFHAVLDTEKNAASIEVILKRHAQSDLIVFPEASMQGYMPFLESESVSYYLDSAIDLSQQNDIIDMLQSYADTHNQTIIIGGMERDDSEGHGQMFDTAFVFTPNKPLQTYRKTHLATNEPYFLFAGNTHEVFDTPVGKIGVLICYDKCFCEAPRTLALKGAEILVIISAWAYSGVDQSANDKQSDHSREVFDVYDQVRAVENQCVVVGSNQVGVNDDRSLEFLGRSKIVAASGYVLGALEDKEEELSLDIDLPKLLIEERVLNLNALNILRNRRPGIYFD